ncbi:MAG: hypothetical protein R3F23_03305 [Verrucomicrobiia bacterium]
MNVILILYIGLALGYWWGYEVRGNIIKKLTWKCLRREMNLRKFIDFGKLRQVS